MVGAGWLLGHLTLWVRGGRDVAKQGVDANQLGVLLCYKLDISKRFANAADLVIIVGACRYASMLVCLQNG